MSTRHSLPSDAEARRPVVARIIRWLSVPIILGWLALAVVVNIVAPQLEEVGAQHSVTMTAKDAPSTIAMMRIGKNFQQFDSDTTAMVLLEGQDKLGDDAHRYYDTLIQKFSQDTTRIEHINNFWGDPLTAAGSQASDGKAAYVQLNLRGDQGGTVANESVAAVQRIIDGVPPPPGIRAYVTGPGPLATDRRVYGDEGAKKITMVTLAVITLMLLLVYRSIFTTVCMLFTIGIELQAARGVIAVLGNNNLLGLSTFAVNLLIVLAIAASTDYVIFWVGRYQEARSRGLDRKAAYYNMFSGTAHVIIGSGLTVAGAMYCGPMSNGPLRLEQLQVGMSNARRGTGLSWGSSSVANTSAGRSRVVPCIRIPATCPHHCSARTQQSLSCRACGFARLAAPPRWTLRPLIEN